MAKLHFITGKGGVGKSTVAAALTAELCDRGEGPVLLIDVQGNGRALKLLGLKDLPYHNAALPETNGAYGCRILPRETFKQYFGLLLALGNEQSTLGQITQGLRGKITELLLENKIVSAFVDACPGLEPVVLLGKIHWESTEGCAPESDRKWKHVIVDAPSTGHFTMLFKSTYALLDVFAGGPILKQAMSVKTFTQNANQSKVYIVATPEELPLQESIEMTSKLKSLGLQVERYFINRAPPSVKSETPLQAIESFIKDSEWKSEAELQCEIWQDQLELIENFKTVKSSGNAVTVLPEVSNAHLLESLRPLRALLGKIFSREMAE